MDIPGTCFPTRYKIPMVLYVSLVCAFASVGVAMFLIINEHCDTMDLEFCGSRVRRRREEEIISSVGCEVLSASEV